MCKDKKMIIEHGCLQKLKDETLVVPFACPVCNCRFNAGYDRRKTGIERFTGWKRLWFDGYPEHFRYVSESRCPECDSQCISYYEPRSASGKYVGEA